MSAHGTISRYNNGCHCPPCRRANRLRRYRWDLSTDHGAELIWTDAAPILEHIAELKSSGWTHADIGREIGKGPRGIHHIVGGYNQRGRIRRETAAAILGLEPLRPVDVDEVVVERLIAGADWRIIGATRAERLAAASVLPATHDKRLGLKSEDRKRLRVAS